MNLLLVQMVPLVPLYPGTRYGRRFMSMTVLTTLENDETTESEVTLTI